MAAAAAGNYAVARLAADVGLAINEARMLDLDEVRWELGGSASWTSAPAKARGGEGRSRGWCR